MLRSGCSKTKGIKDIPAMIDEGGLLIENFCVMRCLNARRL